MKYNYDEESTNHPVFHIQKSESGDYGHIYIQPVFFEGDNTARFYREWHPELENFSVTCQYSLYGDEESEYVTSRPRAPYAFKVGYSDGFNFQNMDNAEKKIKFLKKIDKKVREFNEKFGYSDNFERFVMVIAEIMGISLFVESFQPESWQFMDNIQAIAKIRRMYSQK